jgi:hypothetical protein
VQEATSGISAVRPEHRSSGGDERASERIGREPRGRK